MNPFRKRKICVENPFFHIILIKSSNLIMISTSHQNQEFKRSGRQVHLKNFYKKYVPSNVKTQMHNIKRVCICHLTFFLVLPSSFILSIFKNRNRLEGRGGGGGGRGGERLERQKKIVKRDGSYLLIVDCDDCLKHDRLLTLSRYIYSNTGANIVLPPSL